MSGHDPLCQTRPDHYPSWCDCPRVQAIRTDQDNNTRAKVEALRRPPWDGWVPIADVLALLGNDTPTT